VQVRSGQFAQDRAGNHDDFLAPVGIDIFLITPSDDVCLTVTTSPSRL
jgi:hypothetical protein